MRRSRGGTECPDHPHPLKNHKNIGVLSNTGTHPLNKHKAAKPAFNVGPSLAQGNTFRWLLVVFVFVCLI